MKVFSSNETRLEDSYAEISIVIRHNYVFGYVFYVIFVNFCGKR